MRISAAGSSSQHAFTLIEVLVVVAIAGILVAVAAVNLFPDEAQLSRQQANDVALAVEHARDTAWFGGLPISITFDGGRVREWRLRGSSWNAEGQRELVLPETVRIASVQADGQELGERERLVFLSDGLATPFRIALRSRGLPWTVEGDAAGTVRLVGGS